MGGVSYMLSSACAGYMAHVQSVGHNNSPESVQKGSREAAGIVRLVEDAERDVS
jgi:hypothetical protein